VQFAAEPHIVGPCGQELTTIILSLLSSGAAGPSRWRVQRSDFTAIPAAVRLHRAIESFYQMDAARPGTTRECGVSRVLPRCADVLSSLPPQPTALHYIVMLYRALDANSAY
jgi:hypothetical protein